MFDQWVELFRSPNEGSYTELLALLEQNGIPQQADSYNLGSKMSVFGAGDALIENNFANPAMVFSALEKPEELERLYVVKVRKRDFGRARELLRTLGT